MEYRLLAGGSHGVAVGAGAESGKGAETDNERGGTEVLTVQHRRVLVWEWGRAVLQTRARGAMDSL
jgi:hypothetical protein